MKTAHFIFFTLLVGFQNFLGALQNPPYPFPSFDEGIRRYGASHMYYTQRFEKPGKENLDLFIWQVHFKNFAKELYHKNAIPPAAKPKDQQIPKVIHQIWLGSSVPDGYKKWMDAWAELEGWEYKLWTDADVEKFNFTNKDLYLKAKNYGERSDILRLEILNQEGGVYVDTDMELTKPEFFNYANENYDLYVGLEPIEHGVAACNAVIGVIPHHPLIQKMIIDLPTHLEQGHFTQLNQTVDKTGPGYFSRKFAEYGNNHNTIDIIFPPTFFYPFNIYELDYTNQHVLKLVRPETSAIHWWGRSWWKASGQVKNDSTPKK